MTMGIDINYMPIECPYIIGRISTTTYYQNIILITYNTTNFTDVLSDIDIQIKNASMLQLNDYYDNSKIVLFFFLVACFVATKCTKNLK